MKQWPTTRDSLLVNLAGEQFQAAWLEFTQIYEPVIYRFARKRGLQHADAVELTQQVMLSVMRSSRQWAQDQPPDHFRGWLKTVANNSLINMVTRDARYRAVGGESDLPQAEPVTDSDEAKIWADEESRAILKFAAANIRHEFSEDSWLAFEHTLVQGMSVEAVADSLKKTSGAIYAARARIMRRLKQESQRIADLQLETQE